MEQGAKTRLTTAIILAVVFGSGVLLGLAADSSLLAEPSVVQGAPEQEAADSESSADEQAESDGARRFIYHQVDPNEEQLASIEVIVAEMRARRDAFDDESRARWQEGRREFVLEAREAIKDVLSPEQAADYQRLLDEWEAERAADRENEDDRN